MKLKINNTMFLEKKDVAYLLLRGKNPILSDKLWIITVAERFSNSIQFTDPDLVEYVDSCEAILAVDEMEKKSAFELNEMMEELDRKLEGLSQRKRRNKDSKIDEINYQKESIKEFAKYDDYKSYRMQRVIPYSKATS